MGAEFRPHVTERRAKRLAFAGPGESGLVNSWVTVDLSKDIAQQFELAEQAARSLGGDLDLRVIHSSMAALHGGELDQKEIEFVCWRLAANYEHLKAGIALTPMRGVFQAVIAPLQIVHAKVGWSRGAHPRVGTTLTFKVIDGEYCPFQFLRWFPNNFLWVLARELGIGNYRARRRYAGHRTQLVGMRFVATLTNSKYETNAITFDRVKLGQFGGYNRNLMELRVKLCPVGCGWSCHNCTLGADATDLADACPEPKRACRPQTLKLVSCAVCGKETYHDGRECADCRRRPPSVKVSLQ